MVLNLRLANFGCFSGLDVVKWLLEDLIWLYVLEVLRDLVRTVLLTT